VDFKNGHFGLNISSQYIMEDLPKRRQDRWVARPCAQIRRNFNRIDEIIFDRLDDRQITRIVDIQLERLSNASPAETSAWN
jgi:ATP-dependent Clp protease ATP-binding subunit ClpA